MLVGLTMLAVPTFGCAGRFPVGRGQVLTITGAEKGLQPGQPGYETTLQIHWLGAACHLIRLGDVALLTDPFLSRQGLLRVALGEIASDPAVVRDKIASLSVARAIFIGHSHYDHLLDAAETLKQPGWEGVPVYGSQTTGNILAGYYGGTPSPNSRLTQTSGGWHAIGDDSKLKYKAFVSQHAPQLPGMLLYPGKISRPLEDPPRRARDFKCGETHTYVFRLSNGGVEFAVYFVGAGSSAPVGFPDGSVRDVDVAVFCVPGWKNVRGYPEKFIARLEPAHILLTHYDNMFQTRPGVRQVIPTADLRGFLTRAQNAARYPRFKRILVPDLDTVLHFQKP